MLEEQAFKSVRHRFYKLGRERDMAILKELGKIPKDYAETLTPEQMKPTLLEINFDNREQDLVRWIKFHEEQIQEEKDVML